MSFPLLITFFVFVFGTIVGSFLNVVILRYNTGKNIGFNFFKKISGPQERSMCFSCGKMLAWYELVPVLSFCVQRGKCRGCGTKISWQYPLVELATGLIFVAIFWQNFPVVFLNPTTIFSTVLFAVIWSLLIVITVYDLRHKIIPDGLVYAFAVFSLASAIVAGGVADGIFSAVLLSHALAAVAFFAFFGGLWLVSGGRWLGFGDAKLVVGVGLLLGLAKGFTALTLAFWIGAVVSIALLFVQWFMAKVVQRSGLRGGSATLTMKSEIPFAPFIILGTLISFFWTLDIFAAVGQLFTF